MNIDKILNNPMSLEEAEKVFISWENLCLHNACDGQDSVDEDSVELYRAIKAAQKAFEALKRLERRIC